jgi:hypothetical protein
MTTRVVDVNWRQIVSCCHQLSGLDLIKMMIPTDNPKIRAVWLGCYFDGAIMGKYYTEPYEKRNNYETIKYLAEFYLNRAEYLNFDAATFRSVIDEATRTWKMPQIVKLEPGDVQIPDSQLHQT